MFKRGKRAQLTLFVIIAIIIVSVIILFFLLSKSPFISINPLENPRGYFQECMDEPIESSIDSINLDIISKNLTPTLRYNGEEIFYLCYAEGNNELCETTIAPLTNFIRENLHNSLKTKVDSCFELLGSSLKEYNYNSESTNFEVQILPGDILFSINKKISFEIKDQKQAYETFDISKSYDLFEMLIISNEILNQEVNCNCKSEFCNADIIKLNEENKKYTIIRELVEFDKKIYIIMEPGNDLEFKFGVRNCVKGI